MVDVPVPLFLTVFATDTLEPVTALEGAVMELTTRSTPLVTVMAPVTAVLFISSLSRFVPVASAIAPM